MGQQVNEGGVNIFNAWIDLAALKNKKVCITCFFGI